MPSVPGGPQLGSNPPDPGVRSRVPPGIEMVSDACVQDSHAVDALVDVDGVLAGHHLIDGGAALLLLALLRCHLHNTHIE